MTDDNSTLRRAVRGYLAERPAIKQTSSTIQLFVSREHACSLRDVESALRFLDGLGHTESRLDPLGSQRYWGITSQGILAHERGE